MRRSGYRSVLLPLTLAACGGSTPPEPPTLRAAPDTVKITETQPGSVVLTARPPGASIRWWVQSITPWMRLSSDSGTVNGTTTLSLAFNISPQQEPAVIDGPLVFGTPAGNVTVQVRATVPRSGRIVISPSSLVIPAGSDTGEVTLTNPGHGSVSWRGSSSVPWLTLPVLLGIVETGESVVVKVVVHRESLPPGTASGSVGIFSGSEVAAIQVPVEVTVPTPP